MPVTRKSTTHSPLYAPRACWFEPFSSTAAAEVGTETQQVVMHPEYLYGDCCGKDAAAQRETVTLTPTERVCYTIETGNVEIWTRWRRRDRRVRAGAHCSCRRCLGNPASCRSGSARPMRRPWRRISMFSDMPEPAVLPRSPDVDARSAAVSGLRRCQRRGDASIGWLICTA